MNQPSETIDAEPRRSVRVVFDPANVWRTSFVLLAVVLVALVVQFVFTNGASALFTILMAWFASLAMEPAVSRLARRMKRALATGLVMISVVLFFVIFLTLFGQLFVNQVAGLIRILPELIQDAVAWVNKTFEQEFSLQQILSQISLTPERAANYAGQIAGGVLTVLASVAGGVATFFMFALFTFYLSSDGPRLRLWIASLFPTRLQDVTVTVWDTMAEKTGRYVSARVILATISSTASTVVFYLIGLPSWLALAIWTGLIAQFVPAIGTYISIALPTLVGLLSPNPWLGVVVFAWGLVYQQVENLTFEPRISARAVNVHPAVSFASVILGISLIGVAGALLAIPVVAMLLTLLDLYRTRYELVPSLQAEAERLNARPVPAAVRKGEESGNGDPPSEGEGEREGD